MTIAEGDRLPDAELYIFGSEGPETVQLSERLKGRKVVVFAVPGAFTRTCHSAHLPSFIRTRAAFDDHGVDEVICISVNDPAVMKAWDKATGASAARITMLADAGAAFTRAVGMLFNAPPAGLFGRSRRYAMVVEDGVVTTLQIEQGRGTCELSGGEAILERLDAKSRAA